MSPLPMTSTFTTVSLLYSRLAIFCFSNMSDIFTRYDLCSSSFLEDYFPRYSHPSNLGINVKETFSVSLKSPPPHPDHPL